MCTDASLFGGLIDPKKAKNILDIGTGTGVLSLMMAQKCRGNITAIEIEKEASEQAFENFYESPWKDRLTVIHQDVTPFSKEHSSAFDLIVCNPPFFQNSTKSFQKEKSLARHNDSLSLEELTEAVHLLLDKKGFFWVLLPEFEFNTLKYLLVEKGLYTHSVTHIKNYVDDEQISRIVGCFSRNETIIQQDDISIYQNIERAYTAEFTAVLKPYYLYL